MTFDEYREWRPTYSKYIQNKHASPNYYKSTSIVGLAAEAGELLALVQKAHRNDIPIKEDKVLDELGDCLWYMCYVMDAFNISIDELTYYNKKKLDDRNAK